MSKIQKFEYDHSVSSYGIKLNGGKQFEDVCKILGVDLYTIGSGLYEESYGDFRIIIECAKDMSYIQFLIYTELGDTLFHDDISLEEFFNVLLAIDND